MQQPLHKVQMQQQLTVGETMHLQDIKQHQQLSTLVHNALTSFNIGSLEASGTAWYTRFGYQHDYCSYNYGGHQRWYNHLELSSRIGWLL
jgi:hypothetical protein